MIRAQLSKSLLRTVSAASRATGTRVSGTRSFVAPSKPAAVFGSHTSRITPLSVRAFSSTKITRGQGEVDPELSSKLAQELSYEKENSNLFSSDGQPTSEPQFVKDFKKQGVWKILDKPGTDEICLEREYGNEHIKLMFSVGDIDEGLPESDEDGAGEGVSEFGASPENNPSGAPTIEGIEPEEPPFPVRFAATITKSTTQSAITIDGTTQDGDFTIDHIAFFNSKELATTLSPQADWDRKEVYLGPKFETLDEGLQTTFENYLVERGFDTNLALFIPNYAEFKEQREYCTWLQNVRDFVEA